MRRCAWLVWSLVVLFLLMSAQEVIENPARPRDRSAGRILEIREELRITDEGGDFFFEYPHNVKVAPDGSIFLADRDLMLRFDKDGNFLHNYFKKGQGPGEMIYLRDYDFHEDKLFVIGSNPDKFLIYDFGGELLDEVVLHDTPTFLDFKFMTGGRLYFVKNEPPEQADKPGVFDAPHVLISMDLAGQDLKDHLALPYQFFVSGGAISGMGRLTDVFYQERYWIIAHTEEYLVKFFDVGSQTLVRSFRRKYRRVKPPEDYRWPGIYGRDGKRMGPPPPEFINDISALYIVDDRIWVRTSTRDEDKGFLIDVFDLEGAYVDSFFLNTSGRIVGTLGDRIFIQESGEDELLSIVKYRIIG
ncbi:MAG: 6-bladed beta-propeller [Candidatus Aminicenantaceae bacterium]